VSRQRLICEFHVEQNFLGNTNRILIITPFHDTSGLPQSSLRLGQPRNGTQTTTQMIVSIFIMLAGGANLFFFLQANAGKT